ncbi:MAG: DUF2971 domain-containing protein [Gammaproteobacteria bacterium AqS3]|nr:DUF2971 domain-containing protein [Gammaproteobacteria bacterium AqS3]
MNRSGKQKPTMFYKYMTADIALKTLRNETLRWSSPLRFNDPFDIPRELAEGMEYANISEALSKFQEDAMHDSKIDISDLSSDAQIIITRGREMPDQLRRKYIDFLRLGSKLSVNHDTAFLEKERQKWRETIPNIRILCLSVRKDIVPMWCHYSDNYQGAVIEFNTAIDIALNMPWPNVRSVDYFVDPPELFTEKGWGRWLMLPGGKSQDEMFYFLFYAKKSDWSYEEEYRAERWEPSADGQHYSDYPLPKSSISSIYFGPEIKPCNKKCLMQLIKKKLPHVQMYDMSFKYGWEMKFDPIDI